MILNYIVNALSKLYPVFVLTIVVAVLFQLIPDTILSFSTYRLIENVRMLILDYWVIIAICISLVFSLPKVYRSLERYTHESGLLKHRGEISLMAVLILFVPVVGGKFILYPARYLALGIPLSIIAVWCWIVIIPRKNQHKQNNSQLQPDRNITERELLTEEQNEILEGLLKILLDEEKIKAVGLFGEWGSGKTTIIDMVANEFKLHPDVIWMKFEPWRYTSQEALTLGFYEQIGSAVDARITGKNMSKSVMVGIATKLVAKSDKSGLANLIDPIFNHKSTNNQEQYLTDLLKREKKRLIIVLDDLERMYQPESIFRTLQLAHYLKSSENITYIFLAEKDKLIASAPEHQGPKKGEFLEKFIEFEFNVPTATAESLRAYLNHLLALRKDKFKKDFDVAVPDALIEDSSTHRGILRTFNKFVFDLNKKFFVNGEYNINLSDKYILDHLSVKYPQLWLHIEKHRKLYVGEFRGDDAWRIRRAFEDPKVAAEKNKEAIMPYIDKIPAEHKDFVLELLYDIFPRVKSIFKDSNAPDNYDKWLKDKRVAHPDILALYFATSTPYKTYQLILEDNQRLSEKLEEKLTIKDRIQVFKEYLNDHDEQENSDFLLFLKRDIINTNDPLNRKNAQALIRAYAEITKNLTGGKTNSILIRILSILDDLGSIRSNRTTVEADIYYSILSGFLKSEPHPSVVLSVTLFMHPTRQNDFYNLKQWEGYEKFRIRALNYVDRYYITQGHNLIEEYKDSDQSWTFVIYQWLHQTNDSKTNDKKKRLQRINRYFFNLFDDDKRSYDTFSRAWWGTQWSSDAGEQWNIDLSLLNLLDSRLMLRLLNRWVSSEKLSNKEKKRVAKLIEEVKTNSVL